MGGALLAEPRAPLVVGSTVGRWTILGPDPRRPVAWTRVRCACGAERVVRAAALREGTSRSCGCGALRGGRAPADGRTVAATARVGICLTPTARARLAQVARLHGLGDGALLRAAVEDWVHATDAERAETPAPVGPAPPPERTSVHEILVTPATAQALAALAERRGVTRSAVVRQALSAACAEVGSPMPFAPTGLGQTWPGITHRRRWFARY